MLVVNLKGEQRFDEYLKITLCVHQDQSINEAYPPFNGIRYATLQQADLIGFVEVPSIVLQATLKFRSVVFLYLEAT